MATRKGQIRQKKPTFLGFSLVFFPWLAVEEDIASVQAEEPVDEREMFEPDDCICELNINEVGSGDFDSGEMGSGELGIRDRGSGEPGIGEPGIDEPGIGEPGIDKPDIAELDGRDMDSSGELDTGEIGSGELTRKISRDFGTADRGEVTTADSGEVTADRGEFSTGNVFSAVTGVECLRAA